VNPTTQVVEIGVNGWKIESLQVNPLGGPGVDVLLQLGAKRTDLIVVEGEWYRLFTPIFLHSGVIHLLFNMVGLWNVGVATEREFGWIKTGIIFFVSGFFGVVMSAIFVPLAVGVGASGAIFGLCKCLVVALVLLF
jgi:membrane associated rhomboid family serine protease